LADLICVALETGEIPQFVPVMYAGRSVNPLRRRTVLRATRWQLERFPDSSGGYENLSGHRRTAQDYYGESYNLEIADWEARRPRQPSLDDWSASMGPLPAWENWETKVFVYISHRGGLLEDIASDFGVSVEELLFANPDLLIHPDGRVSPGAEIVIPPPPSNE
jgi:hypothetical protein